MLKNKFKLMAILVIIFSIFMLPIVRAENETTNSSENPNEITNPIDLPNENAQSTQTDTNQAQASANDNLKKGDVYLSGDNVTIDYIVDGNLFVLANTVTINSQIGGDAFICANSVTVGEQGYIYSNLFTFSNITNVNGIAYDLYAFSENTTINGYVYRDIRISSNSVNIFGTVGRNAYIDCSNLNFTPTYSTNLEEASTASSSQGVINGNLAYSSKQEISLPEGAVAGETSFTQEKSYDTNTLQNKIISLGTFVATVLVIWLLCLWLAPKFLDKTTTLITTKKLLPVIGFGIFTPIVGILLSFLLLILGITSTLGFLLAIVLLALFLISTSIFIIALNKLICNKLKIQKTMGIFGMLILSSFVLWLIGLIPYVGVLEGIIAVILGLGIIVCSLVLKEDK